MTNPLWSRPGLVTVVVTLFLWAALIAVIVEGGKALWLW